MSSRNFRLPFLLFFAVSVPGFGQLPSTICRSIFNIADSNYIIFTVWLKNTSPNTIEFAGGQFHFNFNKGLLNGGTGTLTILSSGLGTLAPKNPYVYTTTTSGQLRTSAPTPPGSGSGFFLPPGDSVKVATFRLATSAPYMTGSVNDITFRTSAAGNPFTKFGAYINMVNTEIQSACTFHNYITSWPTSFLYLTSPLGGENWRVGEADTIRWGAMYVEKVRIEYSTNDGIMWRILNDNVSASFKKYIWVIPNIPSAQCRIRVSDRINPSLFSINETAFTISYPPGYLNVLSPNGGEFWQIGKIGTIKWMAKNINNVRIEYSTNNGIDWLLVRNTITASLGKFEWMIPSTASTRCRLRISDVSGTYPGDLSDNEFTISTQPFHCDSSIITYGEKQYRSVGIGLQCWLKENIDIGVRVDGGLQQTANNTIEKYCYNNDTANCRMYGGLYQWDEAMQFSTVSGAQGVCPGGWHIPSLYQIKTVDIAMNGDGNALKAIGQGTGNGAGTNTSGFSALLGGYRYDGGFLNLSAGFYLWSSDEYASTGYYQAQYMHLVNNSPAIGYTPDYKSQGFSIRCLKDSIVSTGDLMLLSPNGGEFWRAGDTSIIRWTSVSVLTIKIAYSTDNGLSWLTVEDSIAAALGSYAWTVPHTPSMQCRIKIADVSNTSNFVYSYHTFSITPACLVVQVNEGWNLFSVPLLDANMNRTTLFPSANSLCFGYNNGYQTVNILENGTGYWLRFPALAGSLVCGAWPGSSVALKSGWNIIGVHAFRLFTADITTTPSGIIQSWIFGYDINGYHAVSVLEPGKGYWVWASQAGLINLPEWFEKKENITEKTEEDETTQLTVSDARGRTAVLFIASAERGTMPNDLLPPVPPDGIFDVRFSTGRDREVFGGNLVIRIQGAEYPVRLRAVGIRVWVRDAATGGKLMSGILNPGEEIEIFNKTVESIAVSTLEIPLTYELTQNYPNPFNPTTTIRFSLPEKADVTLAIYSQLGQEVTTLLSEEREAGYHTVEWNAANYSSGVYLVEMRTEKFRSVKKIIHVK